MMWKNAPALVGLCTCLLFTSGCRDEARQGYVELTGRVVIMNPRMATATFVVTLSTLAQIPEGSHAVALFENPAGGDSLRVDAKIWPKTTKIALESPSLQCLKKDRRYNFTVKLLGPAGQHLQVVESTILSTLDQSILPDAPLVVGPAYEPNPVLKGDPAGKIKGMLPVSCPN